MTPVWFALVLIAIGGALVYFGWTSERGFEAMWSAKGFARWLGSIGIGLGLYVFLKDIFGTPTPWKTVYQSGLGFISAYIIVGIVYKAGTRILSKI